MAPKRQRVSGGPIGTADTAPPTAPRTALVPQTKTAPPAPPTKTAPTAPRTALVPPTKTAPTAPPTKTAPPAPPTKTAPPAPPTKTAPPTAHYQHTVDINYKLTKEVVQLKQDLTKQQQEHDHRTVDLLAQIADLTKKLEVTTTDKNNIYNHYQHWKATWTTQIADQDKTIQDQKRKLDAFATTFEEMAKRPRP
jgi:hypothetical protein